MMNPVIKYFFCAMILLPGIASAAELPALIDSKETSQHQYIGVVSVSSISGSTDEAINRLKKKAAKDGGRFIKITALGTTGDSSMWLGVADVYR